MRYLRKHASHYGLQITSRIIFAALACAVLLYVIFFNFAPLGATVVLSTKPGKQEITLGPPDRIQKINIEGSQAVKQISDIIYFQTKLDRSYDIAKVKITFQNPVEDQAIYLGYQDDANWHYNLQLVDMPLLNGLVRDGWRIVEGRPSIFQRDHKYTTWKSFLENPPTDKVIGIYNFDQNIFRVGYLPDYKPSDKNTVIDTPLRGRVTFYTYLKDEPFKLWLWKQDLNNYPDADAINVKIYKEADVVYETKVGDDGITDGSGKILPPQEAFIQNPGPELPESGVYKVVIDGGGDTVISKIETNLNKIVFDSPLYLISNSEVYPGVASNTLPNSILTDAKTVSFSTSHTQAIQEIKIGQQQYKLDLAPQTATMSAMTVAEIYIPKSDAILKGLLGHFAFSPDQFFQPNRIKVHPVFGKDDIEISDYIVSDYVPSQNIGNDKIAEKTFNLDDAYIRKGNLSWIIKIPGLKKNNGSIVIKNIEINLIKKPLVNGND